MLTVRCLNKVRDFHGDITDYTLQDNNGRCMTVKAEKLKETIRNGQCEVENLTLTSDNRLVDAADKPIFSNNAATGESQFQLEKHGSRLYIQKYIGKQIRDVDIVIPNGVYGFVPTGVFDDRVISIRSIKLPNNTFDISSMFYGCKMKSLSFGRCFNGSKLVSADYMFASSTFESIDLSDFDSSNVQSMKCMFRDCTVPEIRFQGAFNTSKVEDMYAMFYNCRVRNLIFSNGFNTSNVSSMACMFYHCTAHEFVLGDSFNTHAVKSMDGMFAGTAPERIDFGNNFITPLVENMSAMFAGCRIKDLSLCFSPVHVENMSAMFKDSVIQNLYFREGFDTKSVMTMDDMFKNCNIQNIDVGRNFIVKKECSTTDMIEGAKFVKIFKNQIGFSGAAAKVLTTVDTRVNGRYHSNLSTLEEDRVSAGTEKSKGLFGSLKDVLFNSKGL